MAKRSLCRALLSLETKADMEDKAISTSSRFVYVAVEGISKHFRDPLSLEVFDDEDYDPMPVNWWQS